MKKFNARSLNKYLVKTPGSDFSNDGSKFATYSYKNLLSITYTTSKSKVFISIEEKNIPWEFLRNFPKFRELKEKFNGISRDDPDLTNENVQSAIETAAEIFSSEILPAWKKEKAEVFSNENIMKTRKMYQDLERKKLEIVNGLLSKVTFYTFLKISSYDFKILRSYYNSLVADANWRLSSWMPTYETVKKAIEDNFILKEDYGFYVTEIKRILATTGIN